MASYNRVVLIGNVTRDIELKYLPSGMAVTDVGLAVNDRRKNASGEWVDDPLYIDITMFGRTAEIAGEYLTKGSPVFVEGRLKLDTWEKEGQKRSKIHVICDRMQLLGSRGESAGTPRPRSNVVASSNSGPKPVSSDDSGGDFYQEENIPF